MVRFVVKKGGKKQAFDAEKIRLGILRAGAPSADAKKIAIAVAAGLGEKNEVASHVIRRMVIQKLLALDRARSVRFAGFRKAVRRMSARNGELAQVLAGIIGETGTLAEIRGQVRIFVLDEERFDYAGVLRALIKANRMVGVDVDGKKLCITGK